MSFKSTWNAGVLRDLDHTRWAVWRFLWVFWFENWSTFTYTGDSATLFPCENPAVLCGLKKLNLTFIGWSMTGFSFWVAYPFKKPLDWTLTLNLQYLQYFRMSQWQNRSCVCLWGGPCSVGGPWLRHLTELRFRPAQKNPKHRNRDQQFNNPTPQFSTT